MLYLTLLLPPVSAPFPFLLWPFYTFFLINLSSMCIVHAMYSAISPTASVHHNKLNMDICFQFASWRRQTLAYFLLYKTLADVKNIRRKFSCLFEEHIIGLLYGLQAPETVIEKVDVFNGNTSVYFSTTKKVNKTLVFKSKKQTSHLHIIDWHLQQTNWKCMLFSFGDYRYDWISRQVRRHDGALWGKSRAHDVGAWEYKSNGSLVYLHQRTNERIWKIKTIENAEKDDNHAYICALA